MGQVDLLDLKPPSKDCDSNHPGIYNLQQKLLEQDFLEVNVLQLGKGNQETW